MYNNNESCVRLNSYLTDWFKVEKGVRQGDGLSPTLFGLYINDLAAEINQLELGVNIGDLKISILLYADDIVILANSEQDLQQMLNTLNHWCQKWQLNVNEEKTKIIHFRGKKK